MNDHVLYEVTEGNPPAVIVGDDYMLSMVEPCVHGNYARHIVTYISSALGDVPHGEWCDGKPEATDLPAGFTKDGDGWMAPDGYTGE